MRVRGDLHARRLVRHAREAVAVDPATTRIYLTEDAADPSGLYYRWTHPPGFVAGRHALRELAESVGGDVAGRLQAMRCLADGRVVRDLGEDDAGPVHHGQVWFHDPGAGTVTLTVLFGVREDPDLEMRFERPDNITISPQGGLVLAEDADGTSHLVGMTARGRAYALARNDLDDSEFCGPVFSQDGVHLFVNLQQAGLTLAITGPWTPPEHELLG